MNFGTGDPLLSETFNSYSFAISMLTLPKLLSILLLFWFALVFFERLLATGVTISFVLSLLLNSQLID